jgi:hypothetical protein
LGKKFTDLNKELGIAPCFSTMPKEKPGADAARGNNEALLRPGMSRRRGCAGGTRTEISNFGLDKEAGFSYNEVLRKATRNCRLPLSVLQFEFLEILPSSLKLNSTLMTEN